MGFFRHHAIVVIGFDRERVDRVRSKAVELEMAVSEVVASPVNGFFSFLVAPDGSKEGWTVSDKGDRCRAALIHWIRTVKPPVYVEWAEVVIGSDEPSETRVKAYGGKADGDE